MTVLLFYNNVSFHDCPSNANSVIPPLSSVWYSHALLPSWSRRTILLLSLDSKFPNLIHRYTLGHLIKDFYEDQNTPNLSSYMIASWFGFGLDFFFQRFYFEPKLSPSYFADYSYPRYWETDHLGKVHDETVQTRESSEHLRRNLEIYDERTW